MFERLSERLQNTFQSLRGQSVLTEKNIDDAMREVRRALLEADVNYEVVKDFVSRVREQSLGEKVLKSVTPGQQAVKIVHDELVQLLGEEHAPIQAEGTPGVIMLCGLYGSGKTTTAAKLAKHFRDKEGKSVLLGACDLHRPAAIDQLEILGQELDIPVYVSRETDKVPRVASDAKKYAADQGYDLVILDTAGRHQIEDELVQQLVEIRKKTEPSEVLLVADAALGQEAVSVAQHFNDALSVTGLILTKLDGDARGGAALSMKETTGRPVKYVGVGERTDDLEPFHPDRMASRILGMGDVVTLVEKASEEIEEEEAEKLEEKMRNQQLDFNDFLKQLNMMRKMGGMSSVLGMLPGMGGMGKDVNIDDDQFKHIEAMIQSMTPSEREQPELLGTSRKKRISNGSGMKLSDVDQLIKRFSSMKKMLGNTDQMEQMMSGLGLNEEGEGTDAAMGMPGGGLEQIGAQLAGGGQKSGKPSSQSIKKKRKQQKQARKKGKKKGKKKKK